MKNPVKSRARALFRLVIPFCPHDRGVVGDALGNVIHYRIHARNKNKRKRCRKEKPPAQGKSGRLEKRVKPADAVGNGSKSKYRCQGSKHYRPKAEAPGLDYRFPSILALHAQPVDEINEYYRIVYHDAYEPHKTEKCHKAKCHVVRKQRKKRTKTCISVI